MSTADTISVDFYSLSRCETLRIDFRVTATYFVKILPTFRKTFKLSSPGLILYEGTVFLYPHV
jgi:hypothetical protein